MQWKKKFGFWWNIETKRLKRQAWRFSQRPAGLLIKPESRSPRWFWEVWPTPLPRHWANTAQTVFWPWSMNCSIATPPMVTPRPWRRRLPRVIPKSSFWRQRFKGWTLPRGWRLGSGQVWSATVRCWRLTKKVNWRLHGPAVAEGSTPPWCVGRIDRPSLRYGPESSAWASPEEVDLWTWKPFPLIFARRRFEPCHVVFARWIGKSWIYASPTWFWH